jgi:MtrB/PioB family decaheme-associated outer membrane protein
LPQARLDGGLDVVTVNVRANFRPRKWRKLTLRGAYHLDDRDVDKSRDPYRYIRGDGADQPAAELAIFNIARDVEREGFELAGDYRVARRGKLTIRYAYEQVERQHAAVGKTETDSYEGVFRIAPWQGITFRLEGGLTDRGASDYDASQSFFAARTAEFIDQTPADQRFDNHPLLRQSHLANRETTHVRLRAVVSRQAPWHFSLDYLWRDTDYDRSQLGLTDSETNRVSLDAQYVPGDAFTAHAFYSYENYDSKEGGRAFLGGIEKPANRVVPPLPQGSDPTRDWSVRRGDDVHSVGAGVSWDIVPERWDLEAQYLWVFTEASTHFGSGGAADLDTTPLPDLETRLHSIDLRANLRLRTSLVVSFRYAYYRYEEDDWGLNGVDVATLDNVLGLGEREDDESVNLFGISVRYGF